MGTRTVEYVDVYNDYNGGSGNCCPSPMHFGDFSVSPSTVYTYQIVYKTATGYAHPNYMYHYEYNGGTYVTEYGLWNSGRIQDLGDGWKHAWGTFTSNASTNRFICYLFHYEYGIENRIEVAGVMLTQGSSIIPPSQFLSVNTTRSNTQGLVDLTGTSTIDLANVSFDSNAQIVFDGTDDVITVPMDNLRPTSAITQEVVVYIDNNTTQVWIGSQYGTSSGNSYALWLNGADTLAAGVNIGGSLNNQSQSYPITLNTYYHFVHTYDGTTQRIYANGVEIRQWATSGNITYNTNNTLLAIGNDWNGSGYNTGASIATHGKQDITKIYNRALTASEVQTNFKNYRKRFEGLDYYYDNTTDGGRWIRFWWYTGVGWPGHETEALGHPFGTFDPSSHYGFQRLPEGLNKDSVELLAKDGDGNIYKWDFADTSGTAQSVWDSFTQGTQGVWANNGAFMPTVIAGGFHGVAQDTWQYRVSEGVASFLLDDDSCDCVSTLNAGHAMCGDSGWNQTYAQPDGAYLRYGVDTLNDGGCLGPVPTRQLELYYRIKQ